MPLLNAMGQPVAAFSVPASQDELAPEGELVRSLVSLARSISHQLGYALDSHDSFV